MGTSIDPDLRPWEATGNQVMWFDTVAETTRVAEATGLRAAPGLLEVWLPPALAALADAFDAGLVEAGDLDAVHPGQLSFPDLRADSSRLSLVPRPLRSSSQAEDELADQQLAA